VVVFVETRAFTSSIHQLLADDEYRLLQLLLLHRPTAGIIIQGTGGIRKIRWAGSGRGKRGGLRIIYFWHPASARILLLFTYPKNERDDLTASQRAALRQVVETEYP
jgi:hypothetical protein